MKSLLRPAFALFCLLTLLTGVIYPLVITGIASAIFPAQAKGSLIVKDGRPVGSQLIGQSFSDPKYFWSRPSATSPYPYNGTASSGSNQGPVNPALLVALKTRIERLKAADPGNLAPIPVDLVTASASGLDPHISIAAANYQIGRVARARGVAVEQIKSLVESHSRSRVLGLFGEPRVNVLELNLALDALR